MGDILIRPTEATLMMLVELGLAPSAVDWPRVLEAGVRAVYDRDPPRPQALPPLSRREDGE